jgi:hypothetical protein
MMANGTEGEWRQQQPAAAAAEFGTHLLSEHQDKERLFYSTRRGSFVLSQQQQ